MDMMEPAVLLTCELAQARESGHDVAGLEATLERTLADGSPGAVEAAWRELERRPLRADWPYDEPSGRDEIIAALPPAPDLPRTDPGDEDLRDRLLGAWLGRCAGCALGKPVEGWSRERIRAYLDLGGAYPIADYLPVVDGLPRDQQLNDCWPETTRGNIHHMARDDDIDYTILGLRILEQHGFGFTTADVAFEWLDCLPYNQVYTAERVAYHNLVRGLPASEAAAMRNPYREWIGAQIRADMWGYVSPGDPRAALDLAFRDASLSHTGNGIYGELWASALIALSLVATDLTSAVRASLNYVPQRSRLHEALRTTLDLHAAGLDWDAARDEIEVRYGHYSRVHTINNATLVAAALVWGDGDFSRTIGLAVEGGWDTDCTGATAGSIYGALHGAAALPAHWTDPLNDTVRTAIIGSDRSSLTDLAERTYQLARQRPGA